MKSLFSLNLLVRDEEKSRELSAALQGLQAIQDSLPLGAGRKIQQDIPVGVYNIIADFGQSRGSNTATILRILGKIAVVKVSLPVWIVLNLLLLHYHAQLLVIK